MIKSNYKNTQNKWQEDYAKWFIELNKKKTFKKKKFSRNFKGFYKKMITIYLFTKKKINFIRIQFSKKLFTLIISKEFITKFQFAHKNYFSLAFTRKEWIFTILFIKVFQFAFI